MWGGGGQWGERGTYVTFSTIKINPGANDKLGDKSTACTTKKGFPNLQPHKIGKGTVQQTHDKAHELTQKTYKGAVYLELTSPPPFLSPVRH